LLAFQVSLTPLHGKAPPTVTALPLSCQGQRCEFVLPASAHQHLIILGSLAHDLGPHRVRVCVEPTEQQERLPLMERSDDSAHRAALKELGEKLREARGHRKPPKTAPISQPAPTRSFHVFVKEDLLDRNSYVEVVGQLRATGRHCLVYVDRDWGEIERLEATIADAVRTFDEHVHPRSVLLGRCADVDANGKFVILFTGWLSRMSNGTVSLGGFVRGTDLSGDMPRPFGNHADMMYLNTNLRPGPHLRTLLAHEHTHAVIYSEHVLTEYLPGVARLDEECWLNEAIAHLVEDMHGFCWSNLDHRVRAYLEAPHRYPLVVPDYYHTGLWRTPGVRGSTYLFLRWCVDRFGEDLLARLTRTNLTGVANLEVSTGEPFEKLFREWSVAMFLSGTRLSCESVFPLKRISLRGPLGREDLHGVHVSRLSERDDQDVALGGTSVAYFLLAPSAKRARVVVEAEEGTALQLTLLRLPNDFVLQDHPPTSAESSNRRDPGGSTSERSTRKRSPSSESR
jgi:hypothetical protein